MTRHEADGGRLLTSISARLGRDTAVYAVAGAVTLPFGLLNVAVLTRLLAPSEYGALAVLLVTSGLLTTLYNVGTLQGTFALVYGAGLTDGDEAADVEADASGAQARDKRAALTTGLVVTAAVLALVSVPLLLAAPDAARVLLGDPGWASAFRWAVASAAAGSIFRLTVNVFRIERRPVVYASLSTLRPAASLGLAIPLVVGGAGVGGVLAGIAAGTVLTSLVAIAVGHDIYAAKVEPGLAPEILRRGLPAVPVAIGVWTLQNADTFLLSVFESDHEVAAYRVANRLSALMLFAVSAFLMASGPLERTSLVRAAHDRFSRVGVRSLLVTYYVIAGMAAVVAVAAAADALILVAGSGYRTRAGLIPILSVGFLGYGLMILLSRVAVIPRRGARHRIVCLAAGVAFVVAGSALTAWLGALGAALALPIVTAGAGVYWFAVIRASTEPLAIPWRRLGGGLGIAAGCYAVTIATSGLEVGARAAADVVATIACPLLFVLLGIVPRHHLAPLRRSVAAAVNGRPLNRDLSRRLGALHPAERTALREAVRPVVGRVALAAESEELSRGLEALAAVPAGSARDEDLLALLFGGAPEGERMDRAQALWDRGVDPLVLHELEEIVDGLRRLPARAWPPLGDQLGL